MSVAHCRVGSKLAKLALVVLIGGTASRGSAEADPSVPGNTAAEGATLADSAESSPTSDEDVSNRLEPLAWIVGKWAGGGAGDNRVEVSCAWTKNERFITRQFSVIDPSGDALLDGTQVIGWDPASETIRSWTFDSEGGFGEAAWSLDGDRWLIKSAFTLATGEKASALNVLTRLGDDTATWASVNREVDGQLQPNLPEIKVARVASESDMATSQEATE